MDMLKKFAVTNYRGFKDRIEWDLSHPSNYTFHQEVIQDGIIKNGIIYGPNGAGKSNFSLALFDIENHLSQKEKNPNYYLNFVYAGQPELPVVFEYTFQFGDREVYYAYSKNRKGLLVDEKLVVDSKQKFSIHGTSFEIDESEFPMDLTVKKNIIENANHLSIVNFLLTRFPLPKGHYLIELQNFANSMLWFRSLGINEYIGLETGVTQLEDYIISHKLLNDFQDFLYQVSDQKFNFIEPKEGDKRILCKIENNIVPFSILRSTGTNSLTLLYYWYKTLAADHASFVFIDEFDAFYHFKLSFEVCKRLFSQKCQIFTSSHNTYLMTNYLLRPDCNFLLNHNKIKPLNECTEKELRFGHNMEKLYRGGAFES